MTWNEPLHVAVWYGFVAYFVHERRPDLSIELCVGKDRDRLYAIARDIPKQRKATMNGSRALLANSSPDNVRGIAHWTAEELVRIIELPAVPTPGPRPSPGGPGRTR